MSSQASVFPAVGEGADVRFDGAGALGAALVTSERAIHVSAFPVESAGTRNRNKGRRPRRNGTYTRDGRHWYDLSNARTAIGLTRDNRTLVIFTVDGTNGGHGLQAGEVADLLIRDYGVYNALNMDGGGSTTVALEDPVTTRGEW